MAQPAHSGVTGRARNLGRTDPTWKVRTHVFVTYLRRELRRRRRQALLVALGLAVGIGLVITVSAASAGVSAAQSQVLQSLYGVGTDITVTQAAERGAGGPGRFDFGSGDTTSTNVTQDRLTVAPGTATIDQS